MALEDTESRGRRSTVRSAQAITRWYQGPPNCLVPEYRPLRPRNYVGVSARVVGARQPATTPDRSRAALGRSLRSQAGIPVRGRALLLVRPEEANHQAVATLGRFPRDAEGPADLATADEPFDGASEWQDRGATAAVPSARAICDLPRCATVAQAYCCAPRRGGSRTACGRRVPSLRFQGDRACYRARRPGRAKEC